MKVFSILKYFIKGIFLHLSHHSHKYKIVARYFTENESDSIHDIEAFVVYKCELCGDIYMNLMCIVLKRYIQNTALNR